MILKDLVCTPEQSKRLEELGCKIDSCFVYIDEDGEQALTQRHAHLPFFDFMYMAPTSAELALTLNKECHFWHHFRCDKSTICESDGNDGVQGIDFFPVGADRDDSDFFDTKEFDTDAQAYAEFLIYLMENK